MQARIVCECGNEVNVTDEQVNIECRCPRCGRRVFANEDDEHAYFDSHPDEDTPVKGNFRRPVSPSRTVLASKNTELAAVSDPDATVVQTDRPSPHATDTVPSAGMETETISAYSGDSEVNHLADDSGSGVSTPNSTSLKYDLSQRVMRPITKPVLPAIPYTGAGEYGIHRILRVHQKGGMGRILVAYDQYLKRDVAIKELHPEVADDDSIVRRFIGEAEITAQLEHPGVVPIHRLGQGRDGLPYYTMKMVKGETLQDAIKAYHRKPSRTELLNLVRRLVSVAKTMAFAHSKGVIHRDLKPANVMLGEHGETLVMDWGLAKPVNQGNDEVYTSIIHQTKQPRPELTMVGAIVGTPAFMSPEQAMAEESMVGPLSDVFSLGTILYYLLAGQTAFSGRSTQEVLSKVRACKPTPPSQIKSNVPYSLEAVCLKAMAKLPEDRYQGATEFADDLCRWLDNEPVSAEKDSLGNKIRRWLSRHRVLAVGFLSVLLLSLIFTSLTVWFMNPSEEPNIRITKNSIEIKTHGQIQGSSGVTLWPDYHDSGALSLICRVKTMETEQHHSISIAAPANGWDLSKKRFLKFSLFEIVPENGTPLQNFKIRLGQGMSYYEYTPDEQSWETLDRAGWTHFLIPLDDHHGGWTRQSSEEEPDMTHVERMTIYFDANTEKILNLGDFEFE